MDAAGTQSRHYQAATGHCQEKNFHGSGVRKRALFMREIGFVKAACYSHHLREKAMRKWACSLPGCLKGD
jgi:hypothetical protein